ncbi:MAG: hypothetical protein IJW97_09655, partial [Clostridia bacterium]|nr:hypothetical protein [Clostridia bacterium]
SSLHIDAANNAKIQTKIFPISSLKSKNFLPRKFLVGRGAKPHNSPSHQTQWAGPHGDDALAPTQRTFQKVLFIPMD